MIAEAMARAAAPNDPRTARTTRKEQMSEKNKQTSTLAKADAEPAPPPFPSPSFYEEIVAPVMAALEQFSAAMPPLDNLAVTQDFITRKRRVPAPFVTHAVAAMLVELELQNVKSLNTAQAFDDKRCLGARDALYWEGGKFTNAAYENLGGVGFLVKQQRNYHVWAEMKLFLNPYALVPLPPLLVDAFGGRVLGVWSRSIDQSFVLRVVGTVTVTACRKTALRPGFGFRGHSFVSPYKPIDRVHVRTPTLSPGIHQPRTCSRTHSRLRTGRLGDRHLKIPRRRSRHL